MFGIPITGPTRVLCDNESVVKNSSRFESTLSKKHNAIAYHMTRWATAAKEIIVGWIKQVRREPSGFIDEATDAG